MRLFLGKTFVNKLTTNACVVSITSKMNKNQVDHGEDWKPRDNINKRGIDWSVAMLVQKGDWAAENTKKAIKKIKENKMTGKPCECELASRDNVNQCVTKDHGFKDEHSFFGEKLREVTGGGRMTM